MLRNWFAEKKLPVVFTREPGGTALGEALRALLLNPDSSVSLHAEALLMFAARRQHLEEVILPALSQGKHVVSDRFTDATYAYQGGGRGLPQEKIAALEQWVQGRLRPDLTILLDVPLNVSTERLERSRDKDRFEREDAAFFKRVRETYLQRAIADRARYAVVNSNRERDLVKTDIEHHLNMLFGL